MQTPRVFFSTAFRLTALHAVLVVAAFWLAGVITWVAAWNVVRDDLADRVRAEIDLLVGQDQLQGSAAVERLLATRSARPGGLDYGLIDAAGNVRVSELPVQRPGWNEIEIAEPDDEEHDGLETERLLVNTVALVDGSQLAVGIDIAGAERIRDALFATLGWTGAATVALSLMLSLLLTRRTLRQVKALIMTSRLVSSGALSSRVDAAGEGGTDLDELSRAFNAMLDRIESLIARVREVSTDIAHDLRTPLSHVRQQLEQALDRTQGENARRIAVERADARLGDVLRTFEAILRLAEIEASPTSARLARVDLADVAERVADAYRPDVEAGGRRLVTELACSETLADADLIAQVIANLVENAMRHTPVGSTIQIATGCDPNSRLSVSDDGPGIPAAERKAVLAKFYKLESSRGDSGAGIGLSIVSAIARRHGAELVLDDAAPGLRVELRFPPVSEAGI